MRPPQMKPRANFLIQLLCALTLSFGVSMGATTGDDFQFRMFFLVLNGLANKPCSNPTR